MADRDQRDQSLPETLPGVLATGSDRFDSRLFERFAASHLGFCPRQAYLSTLGLRDSSDMQGRFQASRLIQDHIEQRLREEFPRLQVAPKVDYRAGPIHIRGQPTCYDPVEDTVYHVKTRDGWYKFHPPVDRHIKQVQVYMGGLDAEYGRLVYVSKSDLADTKTWPPETADLPYLEFDPELFSEIVGKGGTIRDEIVTNGIATSPDEIPFAKCDCYLCETEELIFPDEALSSNYYQTIGTAAESSTAEQAPRSTGDDDDVDEQPIDIPSGSSEKIESDVYHVPRELREFDIWVTWDCREKVALAPWQEGNMYPCKWAKGKTIDPRRDYETAKMVAELPVREIHRSWPFPDGEGLPEQVNPAVLLPHEPPEPPITFIDFDDVRDPLSGVVSEEVVDLLDLLGGYAEISRSGRGLHVYVRGGLPDDLGMFDAPLEDVGRIEIYDHSRFTGGTWRHVKGSPLDEVPIARHGIEWIIETYSTEAPSRY